VIQLAAHEGLRVIADAAPADEALIRSFGASDIVPRGKDVAQRIRELVADGVDAVADGALLGAAIVPAIKDGGQIVLVRGWDADPGRAIRAQRINVRQRSTDSKAITLLRENVEAGILSLRVAACYPADQVVEAHRRMDAGSVRGRITLEF
jgi:D-arabinose 1-dehydrogenase-like Zn-dependent alcohol dehydrogenase